MARVTGYAESLGRATTTSSTFGDAVALTHTPNDNKTVAYLWSCVGDIASTTVDVQVRFNRDTDAVVDAAYNAESQEAATPLDAFPMGGIVIVAYGASPGSKTVSIEFATESVTAAGVQYARIVALELGANDAYAAGTSVDDTNATTTPADVTSSTASTTPSTTGDYLIIGSVEMKHSAATTAWISEMVIDGVTKIGTAHAPQDVSNYHANFYMEKVSLASGGARTAKWQFYISTTGTSSARRGRTLMLRVDDFANSYYAEDRVLSSGTEATYQTEQSYNPTIAQAVEHIVLGYWDKLAGSTSVSSYSKFDDGSVLSENVGEGNIVNQAYPALVAYRGTLASGAGVTWTIQRRSETAGTSTYIRQSTIAILQTADNASLDILFAQSIM